MTEYTRADISQKAEIIDFINYVFSYDHQPHDFKVMLPKVYADDRESFRGVHYLAKEDGQIKAVVTNHIVEDQIGDENLKCGLIGNVAVHPYARGKGFMKTLIAMAKEESKNDGVDILVLGGQRQRYGYFGFENAGAYYRFTITKTNIRHCMKQVDCQGITFTLINDPDAEEISIAKALYEKKPVHAIRPKDEFLHIMHSWAAELHAVKKDGRMIGYVYGNAREVVLEDDCYLPAVLKAWMEQKGGANVELSVSAYEKDRVSYFFGICERASISPVDMICVLNWEKALKVLLGFKQTYCPLQDGEVKLCIEEEIFRISVSNGNVSVEQLDNANISETGLGKEIVKCTHNEAEMLLFGLQNVLNPKESFQNWLPLPFFLDPPDSF